MHYLIFSKFAVTSICLRVCILFRISRKYRKHISPIPLPSLSITGITILSPSRNQSIETFFTLCYPHQFNNIDPGQSKQRNNNSRSDNLSFWGFLFFLCFSSSWIVPFKVQTVSRKTKSIMFTGSLAHYQLFV